MKLRTTYFCYFRLKVLKAWNAPVPPWLQRIERRASLCGNYVIDYGYTRGHYTYLQNFDLYVIQTSKSIRSITLLIKKTILTSWCAHQLILISKIRLHSKDNDQSVEITTNNLYEWITLYCDMTTTMVQTRYIYHACYILQNQRNVLFIVKSLKMPNANDIFFLHHQIT